MGTPDCEDCPDPGACCRYYSELLVGVLLTDEESANFPEAIPTIMGYFLPLKEGTGECLFLSHKGRCVKHGRRKPEVCRRWHCLNDFDEQSQPSMFLQDHPHILRWVLSLKGSP